ncbi:unnamed protein product [Spirodela intermedia]|uniref:Uncharacterized protein n=1 Tax=Spirodela intermedia TaxID=51605 RepID=A0A7I8JLH9_SPIIN|nr:unnamed protein product [Spirodela intermedia]CAA6671008.1 unnamed protein product [Spirodela intermedia]
MYIRVKRHKTTYFVTCDPTDTVLRIKQKLHISNRMCLIRFTFFQVENDAIVALTLKQFAFLPNPSFFISALNDNGEFEDVCIARSEDFSSFS